MSEPISITGFFWMERSDWDALLPHFVDRAKLHATYEQWAQAVETGIQQMSRRGIQTIKVRAEPDEFLRWCRAKNLDIDANARTEYASQKAATRWFARNETKH